MMEENEIRERLQATSAGVHVDPLDGPTIGRFLRRQRILRRSAIATVSVLASVGLFAGIAAAVTGRTVPVRVEATPATASPPTTAPAPGPAATATSTTSTTVAVASTLRSTTTTAPAPEPTPIRVGLVTVEARVCDAAEIATVKAGVPTASQEWLATGPTVTKQQAASDRSQLTWWFDMTFGVSVPNVPTAYLTSTGCYVPNPDNDIAGASYTPPGYITVTLLYDQVGQQFESYGSSVRPESWESIIIVAPGQTPNQPNPGVGDVAAQTTTTTSTTTTSTTTTTTLLPAVNGK